LRNSFAGELI